MEIEEQNKLSVVSKTDVSTTKTQEIRSSSKRTLTNLEKRIFVPRSFCVGTGNGCEIVGSHLESLGWLRATTKTSTDFYLKWTQTKKLQNFRELKEGYQLLNHIPNCDLFTNKLNLYCSLLSLERVVHHNGTSNRSRVTLPIYEFVPETYRLNNSNDRNLFFTNLKTNANKTFINKPLGCNQGKGITLVHDVEQYAQKLLDTLAKSRRMPNSRKRYGELDRVLQIYIDNPLLLEGRKFDIRCYMLIGCMKPYCVIFFPGYVRLSMMKYDKKDKNIITHLTNQFVQKKNRELYENEKENTSWSMERLNEYINEHYEEELNIEHDWAKKSLVNQMKKITLQIFESVRNRLARSFGLFGLYGMDFMVDENMRVWLIEVNINPSLSTSTTVLADIIPPTVKESLNIVIEIHDKFRTKNILRHKAKSIKIQPIQSLRLASLIFVEGDSRIAKNVEMLSVMLPLVDIEDDLKINWKQQIQNNFNYSISLPSGSQSTTIDAEKIELEHYLAKELTEELKQYKMINFRQFNQVVQSSILIVNNLWPSWPIKSIQFIEMSKREILKQLDIIDNEQPPNRFHEKSKLSKSTTILGPMLNNAHLDEVSPLTIIGCHSSEDITKSADIIKRSTHIRQQENTLRISKSSPKPGKLMTLPLATIKTFSMDKSSNLICENSPNGHMTEKKLEKIQKFLPITNMVQNRYVDRIYQTEEKQAQLSLLQRQQLAYMNAIRRQNFYSSNYAHYYRQSSTTQSAHCPSKRKFKIFRNKTSLTDKSKSSNINDLILLPSMKTKL
ncbi:hypothetical protein SNEBB_003126 [Seison nebaliae]|nr:hypothetical protein SNEBB_003126 [Seison nebaliae]